jgi:hypothetical protein
MLSYKGRIEMNVLEKQEFCGVIKQGLEVGLGIPDISGEKCRGYTVSKDNDEPHDLCKGCKFLDL